MKESVENVDQSGDRVRDREVEDGAEGTGVVMNEGGVEFITLNMGVEYSFTRLYVSLH